MFSDFLWTLRSMYIPLFLVMGSEIPEADVYHCVATGYAGIIGGMAAHFYGSRLLLSEHGIYTREREEELIRATWLDGLYKNIWIEQFKKRLSIPELDRALALLLIDRIFVYRDKRVEIVYSWKDEYKDSLWQER